MTDATAAPGPAGPAAPGSLEADTLRRFRRMKRVALAVPVLLVLYLGYVFAAFEVPEVLRDARWQNGKILVSDFARHKVHVTRDTRQGGIEVSYEGERLGIMPPGTEPGWIAIDGETARVDLGGGHVVEFLPGGLVRYDIPGFQLVEVTASRAEGVRTNLPEDPAALPDWASVSSSRVDLTTEAGRLVVTRSKAEVHRYFWGWELWWFALDSPYHGHGAGEILFGPRIDPERPNLQGALQDFWFNPVWHHSVVAWAIFETVLMAFLGTFGAALVALPLGFAAARGLSPFAPVRILFRRLFDFLRGVDALIWTIALSRAFGPGPLTGALAILVTDTGTFGKLFSEALENIDRKQVEGVASTGARPLQGWRWGVLPQLVPVIVSQVLYLFESNTRSATVIGAIVGGGIGLLLTQAIQTQKDWEEVAYYVILVVLMVMVMDAVSGWLRLRLIGRKEG